MTDPDGKSPKEQQNGTLPLDDGGQKGADVTEPTPSTNGGSGQSLTPATPIGTPSQDGSGDPSQTPTTPTGKQEGSGDPSQATTTTAAYEGKNKQIFNKGFNKNVASGYNPFASQGQGKKLQLFQQVFQQEEKHNDRNRKESSQYDSTDSEFLQKWIERREESSQYDSIDLELLQKWIERHEKEIKGLEKKYNNSTEDIEVLIQQRNEEISDEVRHRIQRRLDRYEKDRDEIRQKLEKLEQERDELEDAIAKKRAAKGGTRRGSDEDEDKSDSSQENQPISASSLFSDDNPIKNTVLYVATYFPRLNIQDFKRVVSLHLEGRTTTIRVKESISTEEEKTKITEVEKNKKLTEIWQEGFEKIDIILQNCNLKFIRQERKSLIDFTIPNLRQDLATYFENERHSYFGDQIQRTQELDLILDASDEVAERAIDVAVKAAVYYPTVYAEDWLIELLYKIANITNKEQHRLEKLLKNLARLIYLLQIDQGYAKSENIAISFLERLISPSYRTFSFEIVKYLIDKNLTSGILGIKPAQQILNWLRKLLDIEDLEQEDEQIQQKYQWIQADVYNLLGELLWQSGFYLYIYDFLDILNKWLPDKDTSLEEYSPSNKAALLLLFAYCEEITVKLPLQWYGYYPSAYPFLAPLEMLKIKNDDYHSDKKKLSQEEILEIWKSLLDTIVGLLFHSQKNQDLALIAVLSSIDKQFDSIDALKEISLIIAEWIAILFGFDNQKQKEELSSSESNLATPGISVTRWDLCDQLIRSIISNTTRSQRIQLTEYWTELTQWYLDKAGECEKVGERQLKKQFSIRRKLLREFKKRFKTLQREIQTPKVK